MVSTRIPPPSARSPSRTSSKQQSPRAESPSDQPGEPTEEDVARAFSVYDAEAMGEISAQSLGGEWCCELCGALGAGCVGPGAHGWVHACWCVFERGDSAAGSHCDQFHAHPCGNAAQIHAHVVSCTTHCGPPVHGMCLPVRPSPPPFTCSPHEGPRRAPECQPTFPGDSTARHQPEWENHIRGVPAVVEGVRCWQWQQQRVFIGLRLAGRSSASAGLEGQAAG